MVLTVGASWAGAWSMRSLPERSDAASLVPWMMAWAVAATLVGFRSPQRSLALIVLTALVARAPWVGTPPWLSDDLYRYLFEGRALALGYDVFRHAPASLPGVDDPLRALVNHPEVSSVYPPLALWWFRLLALGGSVPSTQLLTGLVDVVTVALCARHGSRAGALVLALHPLAIVESAGSAHIDVPAIALATAALAADRAGRPWLAVTAAAMGTWTKLFPVVLGPSLLRPRSWTERIAMVGGGALVGVALAAPHLSFGPHLLTGAKAYASSWAFSGFAFPWLEPWLGSATRPLLVGTAASVVLVAHRYSRDPATIWAVAGTTFCLTSPTVHPWYVGWALVPTLFLGRAEWALASVGALCSYRVLAGFDAATGAWTEVQGLWWLVWGSAALGGAAGFLLTRGSGHPARNVPNATAP